MTKKTLITWSVIRDALNWMLVGQIPGICQLLDIPILIMHYNYAGASASFTLLELIPSVGLVPIFTIAACCYPDPQAPKDGVTRVQARVVQQARTAPPPLPEPILYAQVDGKMVPIELSREQQSQVRNHVYRKGSGGGHV